MGIEYYVFAIFIAALICIVAIIFKVLFSNVKNQNKMLDEREKKILETYNAVETIMEEFQDQAKATIDELKLREQEYRAAMQNMAAFQLPPEVEKKEPVNAIARAERVSRGTSPLDANRLRAVGEVIERAERLVVHEPAQALSTDENASEQAAAAAAVPETKAPVFQKFFEEAAEAPPPTPYAPAPVSGGSRKDAILSMSEEGKTDVEIASALGITRNEVQLVLKLPT